MCGASVASAFNFCDAFWQISSLRLLNFNLQSKVMPSSFSLRELLMCKSPILSVLGSWLFKRRQHLSVFISFHYSKTRLNGLLLFPLKLL